jgi:hypothetical protein
MKIYIIGTNERQKIGYSGDVNKRLKTLQTGNPETLTIHHTIEVPNERARLVENKIHKEYNHLRIKGEWFNMTPNKAKDVLDFALIRWADDPLL